MLAAPHGVDLLVRDGDLLLDQALRQPRGTQARWDLYLEAVARCEEALVTAPGDDAAALLLAEAVQLLLDEPEPLPAFALQGTAVPSEARSRSQAALKAALERDVVDPDVLAAYVAVSWQIVTASAAATRNVAEREQKLAEDAEPLLATLRGYVIDVASQIRAAPNNFSVLLAVHDMVPVLDEANKILESLSNADVRDAVAAKLGTFALAMTGPEGDLKAIASNGDLTQPDVVIARALIAFNAVTESNEPVGALLQLTSLPVRIATTFRARVARATAGLWEAFKLWIGFRP